MISSGKIVWRAPIVALSLAMALAVGTNGGAAQAAVAAPASAISASIEATTETLLARFSALAEGDHMTMAAATGVGTVLIFKRAGKPVFLTGSGLGAQQQAGFCVWAARAAVFAIGSAGFALLAASGGGAVLGVFIGANVARAFAAALAGGGGVNALIAAYLC